MILKNANVVFRDGVRRADLRIEGKTIAEIAEHIEGEGLDLTGLTVFPGIIDLHVHLREPGFEYKEDIESGSRAAVKGGVTQVCCMPNTSPVCDNAAVAYFIKHRGQDVGLAKIHPIGAITKGEMGEQLSEIGKMKEQGVVALSDDGRSVVSSKVMRFAMEYASNFDLICLCHCEDKELVDGGVVHEGYYSTLTGLKGIPRAAEDIMIAREICLAQSLDLPVHICHVSTYSGVQLIRAAKQNGVKVTAETCPHYFAATDEIISSFDSNTKVNPPVREEKDRQEIIKGLLDGTIDCIVTDHAPHHQNDKNVEYNMAAFGISGIETSFSFAITYLYETGLMTLPQIAEKMSFNPAKLLKLEGGQIAVGEVADLCIADLNESYVVDSSKFVSKGKNTPFNGYALKGVVKYTFVDGEIKYSEE